MFFFRLSHSTALPIRKFDLVISLTSANTELFREKEWIELGSAFIPSKPEHVIGNVIYERLAHAARFLRGDNTTQQSAI